MQNLQKGSRNNSSLKSRLHKIRSRNRRDIGRKWQRREVNGGGEGEKK
mgnify:CR=1 FL=1